MKYKKHDLKYNDIFVSIVQNLHIAFLFGDRYYFYKARSIAESKFKYLSRTATIGIFTSRLIFIFDYAILSSCSEIPNNHLQLFISLILY